jgi:protease I
LDGAEPDAPAPANSPRIAATCRLGILLATILLSACGPTVVDTHRQIAYSGPLSHKTIAILATDGVERDELLTPLKALRIAGADTVIISPSAGTIRMWKDGEWNDSAEVDAVLATAVPERYDALYLPGGVMNPDKLRLNPAALTFVNAFVTSGRPIAAICHGPWLLINAQGVKDRKLTAWPSLQADLDNAGATWMNEHVVVDGNLVTAQKPEDIPVFDPAMIAVFARPAP